MTYLSMSPPLQIKRAAAEHESEQKSGMQSFESRPRKLSTSASLAGVDPIRDSRDGPDNSRTSMSTNPNARADVRSCPTSLRRPTPVGTS